MTTETRETGMAFSFTDGTRPFFLKILADLYGPGWAVYERRTYLQRVR